MERKEFAKEVEKMIDPIDVGTIHFMETYSKLMPVSLLNKVIESGSKTSSYMGFVVEPYSLFLAYRLTDLEKAKKLIPDNYRLIKTKIFESDAPDYYCIFGTFNVHTSVFWGTRMEFYIIAENVDTGLLSWVIVDYDTNTVSHDLKRGLFAGNTDQCIFTTTCDGDILVDIHNQKENRSLNVEGSLKDGIEERIDQRLWLEGNLSVTYGRNLSNNQGKPFAVIFDEKEVEKAFNVSHLEFNIKKNTWYPGLFEEKPHKIAYFPYAQHFLADTPGHYSSINNDKELMDKFNSIDFEKTPHYSSKSIKKSFMIGQVVSTLIIIILVILLLKK